MAEDLPFDLGKSLENFIGMYTAPQEDVLVMEAISNALDAKASQIDIDLTIRNGNYYIIFSNNAPGMSEKEFQNYHVVSSSTKTKGQGIGFAGVGAKIYLGANGGSEIITVSARNNKLLTSRMYRGFDTVKYELSEKTDIKIPIKIEDSFEGTKYIVMLTKENFYDLKDTIKETIQLWFSSALMLGKIIIFVNGFEMKAWNPMAKIEKKVIRYSKKDITCFFFDCEKIFPQSEKYRDVTYTVFGKRIKADKIDIEADLVDEKRKKVFCIAEVPMLANYLTSNKEGFHKHKETYKVANKVKKKFHEYLRSKGYLKTTPESESEVTMIEAEWTKKLSEFLNSKEFRILNPWLSPSTRPVVVPNAEGTEVIEETDGSQITTGGGSISDLTGKHADTNSGSSNEAGLHNPIGDDEGTSYIIDENGNKLGTTIDKKTRGINVVEFYFPEDDREGWIDNENKVVVYNKGHPLALKFSTKTLTDFNRIKVVITTLIKNANEKQQMEAKEGIEIFEKLFRSMWLT